MYDSATCYYDGNHIVMNENMDLSIGQEMIIAVLDKKSNNKKDIDLPIRIHI